MVVECRTPGDANSYCGCIDGCEVTGGIFGHDQLLIMLFCLLLQEGTACPRAQGRRLRWLWRGCRRRRRRWPALHRTHRLPSLSRSSRSSSLGPQAGLLLCQHVQGSALLALQLVLWWGSCSRKGYDDALLYC
ncbi:unnamed protein product [Urochloa humidicola]